MRKVNGSRWAILAAFLVFAVICSAGAGLAYAAATSTGAQESPTGGTQAVAAPQAPSQQGYIAIAIALSVGMSCLGAGYAVGRVGSAALGVASEKPELLGRSLLFVALAEGIAIYGLLIAILLWIKI
jgi:V/A-type H+-transporting ATPase subunit K